MQGRRLFVLAISTIVVDIGNNRVKLMAGWIVRDVQELVVGRIEE